MNKLKLIANKLKLTKTFIRVSFLLLFFSLTLFSQTGSASALTPPTVAHAIMDGAGCPYMSTYDITNKFIATFAGDIITHGSGTIIEKGIYFWELGGSVTTLKDSSPDDYFLITPNFYFSCNVEYYVQTYAINSSGLKSNGEISKHGSFPGPISSAPRTPPTVTTDSYYGENHSQDLIMLFGTVTSVGTLDGSGDNPTQGAPAEIAKKGFYYWKSGGAVQTIYGVSGGNGIYMNIAYLKPGTYYYQAFAINSVMDGSVDPQTQDWVLSSANLKGVGAILSFIIDPPARGIRVVVSWNEKDQSGVELPKRLELNAFSKKLVFNSPTSTPTSTPTSGPTTNPTPSSTPTSGPTTNPTPTSTPTSGPTPNPTPTATTGPTPNPTPTPTVAPTPTPTLITGCAGATVYDSQNWIGDTKACLTVGNWHLADLQAKGIGNDKISSIKLEPGYVAVGYYNDINFTTLSPNDYANERRNIFTVSWRGFDLWDDEISSMQIVKANSY